MRLSPAWFFRLLLILALAVIAYLATTPVEYSLISGLYDKLQHLLAFLTLALLADLAFPAAAWSWRMALPLLGYGLAIEVIQAFLPYREFSWADLGADGLGLLLYSLLLRWLKTSAMARMTHKKAH